MRRRAPRVAKDVLRVERVALLALILAAGCYRLPASPRPVPNDPRTVTAEDEIAAMMSVHARAYHRAGYLPVTAEFLDLPSLARTVATLEDSRDMFASSRRRRAVAQLAAYGDGDGDFRGAWMQLLDDRAELISNVDKALGAGGSALEKEARVYNALAELSGPCATKDPVFNPPVWQPFHEIDVLLSVTAVNASPTVVAPRIDPQNWSHCPTYTDLFFASSYLTLDAASPTSMCPILNPPSSPDPTANNPKTLGQPYSANLFEDFVCAPCMAEYKNLLGVDTVVNDKPCRDGVDNCTLSVPANPVPYEACYSLGQAIAGCIDSVPVHLTADQGDLTACDAKPDTRVVSRKGIKFRELTVNALYAYALLWVGQAEATQMLAEVVCCSP